MKKLIAITLAILLAVSACAESSVVLGYLAGGQKTEKWIEETLSSQAGSGADHTALALAAMDRAMLVNSSYGKRLTEFIRENQVANPSTRLRIALTLAACGEDRALIETLMDSSVGQLGVMSDVYALLLVQNGYTCRTVSSEDLIGEILSLQLEDGGWAISGTVSDADTTAMVLQAIAGEDGDEVRTAAEKALTALSVMQTENGGFKSYGAENCESSCQVLAALTSMGIDPVSDARFIKNGNNVLDAIASYRLENGGYSHLQGGRENTMAARQALLAYAAYEKFVRGEGALYRFTPVETAARSLKFYLNVGLIALLAITVIIMLIVGKRRITTYLCLLVIFAVAFTLFNVLDIKGVEEYYTAPEEMNEPVGRVTAEIRCDTIIGRKDSVPGDGVILPETEVELYKDDTAASVLRRICKQNQIQLDMDNSMASYISGIGYIYEFDFGPLSGWIYKLNGERLSVGCGECELKDGDDVSFLYTLDLGEDCD